MGDYLECLHHGQEAGFLMAFDMSWLTIQIKRVQRVKGEMLRQEHIQGLKPKTQKEMMSEVPRLNLVK